MAKKLSYSMPRGDTRSLPVSIPVGTYTAGSHIYFTIKPIDDVDGASTDSTAVLIKTLSDADITSTDATNVNYLLTLAPDDTNTITPGVYRAEFEYVDTSTTPDTVITYPDPDRKTGAILLWTITGDVTRRVS